MPLFYFIKYIDSIYEHSLIDKETGRKPVLFNIENWGNRRNDSQHVKLLTEYRLYTYLNNTKYYFDQTFITYNLELRSSESKNTVKGS